MEPSDLLLVQTIAVLRLERWSAADVGSGIQQQDRDLLIRGQLYQLPKVRFEIPHHRLAPPIIAVVSAQSILVIEYCIDLGGQFRAISIRLAGTVDRSSYHIVDPQTGELLVHPGSDRRRSLDLTIGTLFQKLIVTGIQNDQVGLVQQHFAHDRQQPIAGVRHSSAIDHVPGMARVGRFQIQF
jgi:hypothetical protein